MFFEIQAVERGLIHTLYIFLGKKPFMNIEIYISTLYLFATLS